MDAGWAQVISTLLWVGLAVAAALILAGPLKEHVLPRITGVNAFGVRLEFARDELKHAVSSYESRLTAKESVVRGDSRPAPITAEDQDVALRRASDNLQLFAGARVLWVDDHPAWVADERKVLRSLGSHIDVARSVTAAIPLLDEGDYDLIISDLKQGDDSSAGLAIVPELEPKERRVPLIFYTGRVDPSRGVPVGALAITDRPDELLHSVVDALGRVRSGAAGRH